MKQEYLAGQLLVAALTAIGISYKRIDQSLPAGKRAHRRFQWIMFSLLVANELWWFLTQRFALHQPFVNNLPLHLCDFAFFLVLAGILFRRKTIYELAYYLGVSGAVMALAFPNISETGAIRPIATIRFFLTHGILVAMGFYFTLGQRFYPKINAVTKSYITLHLYLLVIGLIDWVMGQNYFYLITPPEHPAFLRQMPSFLFFSGFSTVFLSLFLLLHIPVARARKKCQHESFRAGPKR